EHETVQEAVVLLQKEGTPRLVAYLITTAHWEKQHLIDFLKQRLPDPMIPAQWIRLRRFPENASGKIDRKALSNQNFKADLDDQTTVETFASQALMQLDTIRPEHQSEVTYPADLHMSHWLHQVSQDFPNRTALVCGKERWTYLQLAEQSNQLAQLLKAKGVRKGDRVLLGMSTALDWMVIGIWAVWKVGAVYVPFDPDLPVQRLQFMLVDTGAKAVLTEKSTVNFLQGVHDVWWWEVDQPDAELAKMAKTWNGTKGTASDLAYLIYTSGSTGQPKGVMVTHQNLVDYFYGLLDKISLQQVQRFALLSTLSADLGNTLLYGSLLTGGCLHLLNRDERRDAVFLHNYFQNEKIDAVKIVPSHWAALDFHQLPLLPQQLLIFGGERLLPEHIEQIRQSRPDLKVFNHYGPTETTIGKLLHEVDIHTIGEAVPLGLPFSNTSVAVINKMGKPCREEEEGELLINGLGVAKGYWNQPELTQQQFIRLSNTSGTEQLFYRTGDLVRYDTSGRLFFIGRVDDQVKIRGYRVEPASIAQHLRAHTGVQAATVLVDKTPTARLLAFVVLKPEQSMEGLQEDFSQKVPAYTFPAQWIALDTFPLNQNGKIDRQALLQKAKMVASENTTPAVTGSNKLEEQLIRLWQDLLGHPHFDLTQSFFAVGGDSIKVIRLAAMIQEQLGYDLRAKMIFRYPSIAQLSHFLSSLTPFETEDWVQLTQDWLDPIQQDLLDHPEFAQQVSDAWEDFYPMSDIQLG
ncbi:MAG: amino acid adenylation domain-containing protein, partial [Bacteroidota bacterium]